METAEQITYLWIKRQGGGTLQAGTGVPSAAASVRRGGAAAVGGAGVRSSQSARVLQKHQCNPPIIARLCSSAEEACLEHSQRSGEQQETPEQQAHFPLRLVFTSRGVTRCWALGRMCPFFLASMVIYSLWLSSHTLILC